MSGIHPQIRNKVVELISAEDPELQQLGVSIFCAQSPRNYIEVLLIRSRFTLLELKKKEHIFKQLSKCIK